MKGVCWFCFFAGAVFWFSAHAETGALQFSFSEKTISSINVACATGDAALSASASFVNLVSVNNSTGLATTTAVTQLADSTKAAGADTLFSPNVNVQTDAGSGWQATFSCTPNQALFAGSLAFETFSFNSSGGWQTNTRLVLYRVDILSADGTSLLADYDSVWQEAASVAPGGVTKTCRVDFARRVLLPPNTPFQIRIALKRGSETSGSFFGLKSITLAAEQETVQQIAVNFLGIRTDANENRGLGLPVKPFGEQALGLFPLAAEKWNDTDACDSESNAETLVDATGTVLETSIWRNKRWAVNTAYLTAAKIAAGVTADQALFYGYTDSASAITLTGIPYSAYTLCLYYTSGNDYTQARTFPPALIDSVYYFGNGGTTTSAATASVWGDHRYSFLNPSFGNGAPEYKEGYNLLIIRGQTASTLTINTPSSTSPTFGGIAAMQIIKEDEPLAYTEVYTAGVSDLSAWESLSWQLGYKHDVTLPENLTNATLNVVISGDAALTGAIDLHGANLTFSGEGTCALTGGVDCSTLTLQEAEAAVHLIASGTLRLNGTSAPDRLSLEVAAPNTFTLADGTLFTNGRLTASIGVSGNAFIGALSPLPEDELILAGPLTDASEGSMLTLLGTSPITLAADAAVTVRVPKDSLLMLADRPDASTADVILDGGTLAPLGTHAIDQLTVTADSRIDTTGVETLTIDGFTATEGTIVTMSTFVPGAIRFTSQTDAFAVFNAFRFAGIEAMRFTLDSEGRLVHFNTGTRITLY